MLSDPEQLRAALAKPTPKDEHDVADREFFDPWSDVITGIYGSYSSVSDQLMIECLEAVRDRKTFEFIESKGFVAEFMLYVLAGHGLTDYGTSPRGGWPNHDIRDLWQPLIDKWRAYYAAAWSEPLENEEGREDG